MALALVLLVASLAIVAASLRDGLARVEIGAPAHFWRITALATLWAAAMVLLKAAFNVRLLAASPALRALGRPLLAFSYMLGQLLRYLPGKVFGIAAQSNALAQRIDHGVVWYATLVQFLWTYINSAFVVAAVLAWMTGSRWLAALVALASLLQLRWLRLDPLPRIAAFLARHAPALARRSGLRDLHDTLPMTLREAAAAYTILQLEWVCFFGCWAALLPGADLPTVALLGTLYFVASALGTLVVVLPSGLLVREASFISLGVATGVPNEQLILLAAHSRIVFTLAEIAIFALSSLVLARAAGER